MINGSLQLHRFLKAYFLPMIAARVGSSRRVDRVSTGWRTLLALIFGAVLTSAPAFAQMVLPGPGMINTVAGNGIISYSGDGGPPLNAQLNGPQGIAIDPAGNLYIADWANHRVRMVSTSTGIITTIAGTGIQGYSGDGGPAVNANLNLPNSVALDSSGNLYISDSYNNRIRKVAVSTGIITTVAGGGGGGMYAGDGGPATSAVIHTPGVIALDSAGNLYFADTGNSRVRMVHAATGIINTVAGNGTAGCTGDGGPATIATLSEGAIALDTSGNLYITGCNTVREVDASTGIITTVAGNGIAGYSGDGGAALDAKFNGTSGIVVDSAGNLYIADYHNYRVRKVDANSRIITTLAGTGVWGFSGDGGPATGARMTTPIGLTLDSAGNLYVAVNGRVRRISANTGIIGTVAGNGVIGYSGDGVGAGSTELGYPMGTALDSAGNLYIAGLTQRIRKVTASTGIISTVAGNGSDGVSGDGGPATNAQLYYPNGVSVDLAGNIYIADAMNSRIREVTASTGIITSVAGGGGYSGDGVAATSSLLSSPNDVKVDSSGNLYIADTGNNRIRKVTASTGIITTIAGNGTAGYSGDGGAATSAQLNSPYGVALDSAGNLYIADKSNHCVRKLTTSTGIITTIAGSGTAGYSGDGGLSTSAMLNTPMYIAVDWVGNLYISDSNNNRIRKITAATGIITTIGGAGVAGYAGDGGVATSAQLNASRGISVDASGTVYFSDYANNRVRAIGPVRATPTISWTAPDAITYGTGLSATQLNATTSVPGTFTYSPASGAVLGAGTQTLSVTFTPYDTIDYSPATAAVTLSVNKAIPAIVWAPPADITYGTALSATQLNATSGVEGSFAYSPAAGAVLAIGPQTLSVTFTPADSVDYSSASSTVSLIVSRATPIVNTWPSASSITYGDTLGSSTLSGGSASVSGSFAFTMPSTVPQAGAATQSVTFTPSDPSNYNTVTGTVNVSVSQVTPSITWPTPAPIPHGTALSSAQLNPTASVPGSFTFSPAAGTVLPLGTQTLSATFSPNDSSNYVSVQLSVALTVTPATPQSLRVNLASSNIPAGVTTVCSATETLSDGTTQSATSVAWSSSSPQIASIDSSGAVTTHAAGTTIIQATVDNLSSSATMTVSPAALVSIVVAPAMGGTTVGGTQQFRTLGNYTDGSTQDVTSSATWTSSNSSVASIVAGGLSTGISVGSAQIHATIGGSTASAVISVTAIATPPSIAAVLSPVANANGWNHNNVTVTFTCTAGSSAVNQCPESQTVSSEATGQIVSATVTDAAGATATASTTVNIDKTSPTVTVTAPVEGTEFSSSAITVSGTVSDALSGVSRVSCNGIAATLTAGSFTCNLNLYSGTNLITVRAADNAGNVSGINLRVAAPVVALPAPLSLQVTPVNVSMLTGDSRTFSVIDEQGRVRSDASWSSSDSQVASFSADASETLVGVAPGQVTVTANVQGITAQTSVDVFGGTSLPQGTVLWSTPSIAGNQAGEVEQSVPANGSSTLYSTEEVVDSFGNIQGLMVRAMASSGQELWRTTVPGNWYGTASVPDQTGGLLVVTHPEQAGYELWTLTDLDGQTGTPVWTYQLPVGKSVPFGTAPIVGLDGKVYFVKTLVSDTYVYTQTLVGLDGKTGAEVFNYTGPLWNFTTVDTCTNTTTVGHFQNLWNPGNGLSPGRTATISNPTVGPDGSIYALTLDADLTETLVPYITCPGMVSTYQPDYKLSVLTVGTDGSVGTTLIKQFTSATLAQNQLPRIAPLYAIPDGEGGTLATWAIQNPSTYSYESHVSHGTSEFIPYPQNTVAKMVLGENRTVFATDMFATKVFSFGMDGGLNWSTSIPAANLMMATAGGGVMVRSGSDVVAIDSTGNAANFDSGITGIQYAQEFNAFLGRLISTSAPAMVMAAPGVSSADTVWAYTGGNVEGQGQTSGLCPSSVSLQSKTPFALGAYFPKYKTGMGIVTSMLVSPQESSLNGWGNAEIYEVLRSDLATSSCKTLEIIDNPGGRMRVEQDVNVYGVKFSSLPNVFYDTHMIVRKISLLDQPGALEISGCTYNVYQTYTCGGRTLGRFTINKMLSRGLIGYTPVSGYTPVTVVTIDKTETQ